MPNGDGNGPRWSSGNWGCNRNGFMPRCWAGRGAIRAGMTSEEEKKMLASRLDMLKLEIDAITKRMADI